MKRIAEERELLIERRDRERERGRLDDTYDASTADEAERHDDVELEQQSSDADSDGQDEPAASHGHTAAAEVTGHHDTAPGPQWIAPTSAVSGASDTTTPETPMTAFPPSASTDGANPAHTSDDTAALTESTSGGDARSSGDQQGNVLPFRFDPILVCLTMGCNRRRRVTHPRGYMDQSGSHVRGYRGGVRQSHCCRDCMAGRHSHACCEVGPQPIQDLDGDPIHPVMSLEVQRLIAPPEPVTTALVPQLAQEGNVGEAFFVAQSSSDVFVDDGDDE